MPRHTATTNRSVRNARRRRAPPSITPDENTPGPSQPQRRTRRARTRAARDNAIPGTHTHTPSFPPLIEDADVAGAIPPVSGPRRVLGGLIVNGPARSATPDSAESSPAASTSSLPDGERSEGSQEAGDTDRDEPRVVQQPEDSHATETIHQ